jgi:hypothetical protein
MTTTTDNDNTADIFMKIAREEPALRALEKLPPAPAAETSTIVSSSACVQRDAGFRSQFTVTDRQNLVTSPPPLDVHSLP